MRHSLVTLGAALFALAACVAPVHAQSAPPLRPDTPNPLPGPQRISEEHARLLISEAGFSRISLLMQDTQGAWCGTAMRLGARVPVAVDSAGNVIAH